MYWFFSFLFYAYLYFWLVESRDKAIGLVWVAAQEGWETLAYMDITVHVAGLNVLETKGIRM
jgi:hypothetical protein